MIIDKINKAACILGMSPDLSCAGGDKKLFGIIHEGNIKAVPVADSPFAPIEEPVLTISCYPEYAAGLYQNAPRPVWLYDRLEDIRHMRLPKPENPAWVILVAQMEDFVSANMLADRWTDDYEVSVMIADEKQLNSIFAANRKPVF